MLVVPKKPGLGLAFDRAAIERYQIGWNGPRAEESYSFRMMPVTPATPIVAKNQPRHV
jgi:hypothetical protein